MLLVATLITITAACCVDPGVIAKATAVFYSNCCHWLIVNSVNSLIGRYWSALLQLPSPIAWHN